MSIKINFSPSDAVISSSLPLEDYEQDLGKAYNPNRGYGWVTQASLNDPSPVPVDLSLNTRDRNADSNPVLDTFIHLQYPEALNSNSGANSTPSAWEYNLANGIYKVTVSVGDPSFTDSRHVINLEGQNAIADFAPTADQKFASNTTFVQVTDGKLTLDANGGENTKLNFVEIEPAEGIRVNFGTANINPPAGYVQDIGNAYNNARGFGWITESSVGQETATPLNVVENARGRNASTTSILDTLIHLQYPQTLANPNSKIGNAAWEYNLANGQYIVTVNVGDASFTDSNHVINIEGQNVISNFAPSANKLFKSATKLIDVQDGKLTLDAIGGVNTKINFVEIVPFAAAGNIASVTNDLELPANSIKINFGTAVISAPAGFVQDIGQGFDSQRGYGWITEASVNSGFAEPIDIVANGRTRNSSLFDGSGSVIENTVLDSLIHLQYPAATGVFNNSVVTNAAWEYQLANGQYEVTVSVGDADFADSNHVINIEGQNVISNFAPQALPFDSFAPSTSGRFTTGTATVLVNDGKLTIDAVGGKNTKLNYVSIVPVDNLLTIDSVVVDV